MYEACQCQLQSVIEICQIFRFHDIHKTFKYEHLVGGLCGGMVSTFTLHPLELIRIRFAGLLETFLQRNIADRSMSNRADDMTDIT